MKETQALGFPAAKARQIDLGEKVRALLESKNFISVAAPGFQSPGVVVSYTSDPDIQNGKKFIQAGMQIAAGVPLQCDERTDFRTFRLGLFGLEKLLNVDNTVANLKRVLDALDRT
jgi:aspartate aminotransferase-like enzyme